MTISPKLNSMLEIDVRTQADALFEYYDETGLSKQDLLYKFRHQWDTYADCADQFAVYDIHNVGTLCTFYLVPRTIEIPVVYHPRVMVGV